MYVFNHSLNKTYIYVFMSILLFNFIGVWGSNASRPFPHNYYLCIIQQRHGKSNIDVFLIWRR